MNLSLEEVCHQLEALVTAPQSLFKTLGTRFLHLVTRGFENLLQVVVEFFLPRHCPCQYFIFNSAVGQWGCSAGIVPCFLWILHHCSSCGFNKSKSNRETLTWEGPTRIMTPNKSEGCSSCSCPLSKPGQFPDFPPIPRASSSSSTSSGRNSGANHGILEQIMEFWSKVPPGVLPLQGHFAACWFLCCG